MVFSQCACESQLQKCSQRDRLHSCLFGTFLPQSVVGRAVGLAQQISSHKSTRTSPRTSTGQVEDLFHTDNVNIRNLIKIIGDKEMSVKAMMEGIGLKGRDNFLNQYLTPALSQGYVRMLYPESPRHPRQKYLLTPKGIGLFDYLNSICKK